MTSRSLLSASDNHLTYLVDYYRVTRAGITIMDAAE